MLHDINIAIGVAITSAVPEGKLSIALTQYFRFILMAMLVMSLKKALNHLKKVSGTNF